MDYSAKIKELREKLFMTQEDLANYLQISPITVSRWETGKYTPTIKIKKKIYQLFLDYNIIKEDGNQK